MILRWQAEAEVAQAAMRGGSRFEVPAPLTVDPRFKHAFFRDRLLDCRNLCDCVLVRKATRHTLHHGRQVDRAALRRVGEEVGWYEVDPDYLLQAGEGGIESRSECGFCTCLGFHHGGAHTNFGDIHKIIQADLREERGVAGAHEAARGWHGHGVAEAAGNDQQ